MIEVNSPAEIPAFKNETEEAEFWATHTLGEEYLEQFLPIADDSDEALREPEKTLPVAAAGPAHGARLTPFQQKVMAHELTLRRAASDPRKLTGTLAAATIDLNPHQVDAALFAFRSHLFRGAILADEVGLGKTIEAGLVLAQLWAERRRQLVVIVPASLMLQWQTELEEKFNLPSVLYDARFRRDQTRLGRSQPLRVPDKVVIMSSAAAYRHREEIRTLAPWDLVVMDEAHRLRNAWNPRNKVARLLRDALAEQPKLLLTATPLQNNLMELFGLVSFLDDKLLGTEYWFRSRFTRDKTGLQAHHLDDLRNRMEQISVRRLRKQVQEYVRFTRRHALTQDFTPTDDEFDLYERVSAYLQRPRVAAIGTSQRTLMTLIYRKILASSTFAIAQTLGKLESSLQRQLNGLPPADAETLLEDVEGFEDEVEELHAVRVTGASKEAAADDGARGEEAVATGDLEEDQPDEETVHVFTREEIQQELAEISSYRHKAQAIAANAKGDALLLGLASAFAKTKQLGGNRKAVVFTESRRTQEYLVGLIEANGYRNQVTTYSGSNSSGSPRVKQIVERASKRWEEDRSARGEVPKLSKDARLRDALIHEFRNYTQILVSTEAGAEGLNLQFCSTVVNFDLPWNPQRVEQRIGRCHRYGQQHDVVVLNFVNRRNEADRRVYELLDTKFKLFDGLFGASDEVLGAIGSGVDFERRVLGIYQTCRTAKQIDRGFEQLRLELEEQIAQTMLETRRRMLEHLDDEVIKLLKSREQEAGAQLDDLEQRLEQLLVSALADDVLRPEGPHQFVIEDIPARLRPYWPEVVDLSLPIRFRFGRPRATDQELAPLPAMHPAHPLAQAAIELCKREALDKHHLVIHYTDRGERGRVAAVEPYLGQEGVWTVYRCSLKGLEEQERLLHVMVVKKGDEWTVLNSDDAARLATYPAQGTAGTQLDFPTVQLEALRNDLEEGYIAEVNQTNDRLYEAEVDRLDAYVDEAITDMRDAMTKAEREFREADRRYRRERSVQGKQALRPEVERLRRAWDRATDQFQERRREIYAQNDERMKRLEQQLAVRVKTEQIASVTFELR